MADFFIEYLQRLGLNESEIAVYKGLLQMGPSTVAKLAEKLGLPRINAHYKVEALIKMGFITQIKKGARRMVVAQRPEDLSFLLTEKHRTIDILEKELPQFTQIAQKYMPALNLEDDSIVTTYQGEQGMKELYKRILQNTKKELCFVGDVHQWENSEYIKGYFNPARLEKKIFLKTLAVHNEILKQDKTKDADFLRETRYIPVELRFKPTILITENEVVLVFSSEKFHSLIIDDAETVGLAKVFFNYMWLRAK